VCGALAGAAALVLLAGQHTIACVIIGWCLAQVGLNAIQASVTAGVPDHVPVAQRCVVSGWIGLPQAGSVVLAVALVTLVVTGNAGYVLIATLVVACALPFALTTPDPPLPAADRPPFAWRVFARSFWLSPRRGILRHPLCQARSAARTRSCNSASGMEAASAGLSLIVPFPAANSG
jgi:hypothetical protein